VKIDIHEAFLQTPMERDTIYMQSDPKMRWHAVEMYPELNKWLEEDG
jgi:hypothetical protein